MERSAFDPPAPTKVGSSDTPRVSDLVGFVVCAVNGKEDTVFSQQYGELDVVKLDRLVVFDSDGNGTPYPGFTIFQSILREQMCRPVTIGRIKRPGNAFVLEQVPNALRDKVADICEEKGWLKPSAKKVHRDDEGEF